MARTSRVSGVAAILNRMADEQEKSSRSIDRPAPPGVQGAALGGTTPAGSARPASGEPHHGIVNYPRKGLGRVPAESCRPWAMADRPSSELEHLDDLAASLDKDGQLQPVLVREVSDPANPDIRYEIIAGQARWRAALKAGLMLQVLVRPELSDDEAAFRAMVGENEFRQGLSDYSRGMRYRRALERGLYPSKGEMAAKLRISQAQLSRFLGFAGLDAEIVAAIGDMRAMSLAVGYKLSLAVSAGFKANILRDLPKILSGEITRDEIPGVWEGARESGTAIFPGGNEPTDSTAPAVPATAFTSKAGAKLFTVKQVPHKGATLKLTASVAAKADEQFWLKLRDFIEAELG